MQGFLQFVTSFSVHFWLALLFLFISLVISVICMELKKNLMFKLHISMVSVVTQSAALLIIGRFDTMITTNVMVALAFFCFTLPIINLFICFISLVSNLEKEREARDEVLLKVIKDRASKLDTESLKNFTDEVYRNYPVFSPWDR